MGQTNACNAFVSSFIDIREIISNNFLVFSEFFILKYLVIVKEVVLSLLHFNKFKNEKFYA